MKLPKYDGLRDKHLRDHFRNEKRVYHLYNMGLVLKIKLIY